MVAATRNDGYRNRCGIYQHFFCISSITYRHQFVFVAMKNYNRASNGF